MRSLTPLGHVSRSAARADGHPIRRGAVVSSCAAAACVLLVSACGSAGSPVASGSGPGAPASSPASAGAGTGTGTGIGSSTTSPASTSPAGAGPAQVSLDVLVYAATRAAPSHVTLRCDPAGGTVPDPAAACAQLLADPGLFALPSGHVLCPMILSSGRRIIVYGTYLGKRVAETIGDGGCDLQRWSVLNHVFG